jgi:menaquinol-cytochrome c reductase cytochrome b/c subunit
MATSRLDERRARFQQYKQDVRERGKPFYPYAMFHDTVMSLVVVSVIIGLAVIWKYTIPDGSDGTDPGTLGPLYTEEADPGTTNFIPRPDWYFYFLFYLLRIFKWPESVILGTVGIPTLLLLLLIAMPFLDRRAERRLVRRPVAIVAFVLTVISMGVLTYEGATAKESLGGLEPQVLASWQERNNLPEDALEGANIFGVVGCQQCHTYLGVGSANVGAPDLTDIGAQEGKDVEYFARYVANPSEFGNNVMPQYAGLGDENLQAIGRFLEASKGPQE